MDCVANLTVPSLWLTTVRPFSRALPLVLNLIGFGIYDYGSKWHGSCSPALSERLYRTTVGHP